ncbi:MAG: response regulator [Candidatus Omnitrophica bacterium]|nr:response regulator [Candidatus Omnitrophota bacterium]
MSNEHNGPSVTTGAARVLLVDDDVEAVALCESLLTAKGFAVTTCVDSPNVLTLLKSRSFDVVVLDLRMPTLEGTDLLPLIKKRCPDLPVIVASAYCDSASRRYCRELGACDIIDKPFSPETLLAALQRALRREEAIPVVFTTLSLHDAKDQVYRKLILAALRKNGWNQTTAAAALGISRYGLMRWVKRLGLAA